MSSKNNVIELEKYTPALLTWVSNKLSRGASQHYLKIYGIGIETWRCLVLLAIEDAISAQYISSVIGLDKSSVSRCFKDMSNKGLITFSLDDNDGRLRLASLTKEGRELHDRIIVLAKMREESFLSPLNDDEKDTLNALLRRLHDNLDNVEIETNQFIKENL